MRNQGLLGRPFPTAPLLTIIAKKAVTTKDAEMSMTAVSYDLCMSATINEHPMQIAKARNILGEVIARARFGGGATILINRKKPAAVVVSYEFY